jgi:type I restriction enzyme S subunit
MSSIMREDWQIVKLADIGEIFSGGTPKTKNEEFWGSEVPWITPSDLSKYNAKFISKGHKSITKLGLSKSSAKLIPAGSVLFSSRAPIGYVVIANNDLTTNQGFKSISPSSSLIFNEFVYYYLKSSKNLAERNASGTTFKEISKKAFSELPFPLSPLPEQRAIVAKIEELFSRLDQGIADLKKAQDQLKVYRQAVLQKAFEGELTKEWREQQTDLPTADELLEQIKEERQKHYEKQIENWKQEVKAWEENGKEGKKPGKPKGFKLLPELTEEELEKIATLPKGWKWLKNENYLFEVKDGTHDTPKYQDTGIPFITQKNIKNNSVSFSDIKYISEADHNKFFKRSNVQKGDIIIAMIGHGRGNSCIVDTDQVFSIKNVGLFKFFNEIHNNRYCLHYYQSTLGLNLALKKSKGGAQPFIGLTELRNWPIPICSLLEQHQIVQEIESRLSVCDKVENDIALAIERSRNLRQSILKKAFEGKLLSEAEVAACKAAPDYEPASVLLARIERSRNEKIKAETLRQAQGKKKKKP